MTPPEHEADKSSPYAEAIGQLLVAAERTHDPEAWLTLTTLAEMFVHLDRRHRSSEAEAHAQLDRLYSPPGPDKPS
ncbi:MAG TPA: hypothetical protein VHY19_11195 [Steroidobacteraceae bacterium]|jgi:hypothetical protein|nr:hypothetical protein [Steroidobacteraceae bacterium]